MRSMLTWFFAYDRVNYSRYGTAYSLEMTKLQETDTGINTSSIYCICIYSCLYVKFSHSSFTHYFCSILGLIEELSKQWTVQRQSNHGFSSVACDMAIEQTLNKDSKTSGGKILQALLLPSSSEYML